MELQDIIRAIERLAHIIPLEVFVSWGLFLDELILPVPAPLILSIAGTLVKNQGQHIIYLVWLAFLGAFGKMLGMWVYYIIGEKAEHILVPKYGKMFGVTQKEIDKLSKKLQGGWRDVLVIFFSRLIPFVPTIPVSFICGILQTKLNVFLIASFAGTVIRNIFFLLVGYLGAVSYPLLTEHIERVTQIVMILFFVIFAWWYYMQNKKQQKKL